MKTIIITGAASGVGKEVAKKLRKNKLILIDRNGEKLAEVAQELKCDYFVCDISISEALKVCFNQIKSLYKNIDILVNCAGLWTKGELSQQCKKGHFADINSFENIKEIIDTNTFGTIAMIKSIAPIMIKQGYGQIININSQSGIVTEEFCPVYNASKHGSRAFSQAILSDLARHNIKLTDICPGLIKTDFYVNAKDPLSEDIMKTGLDPVRVAELVEYVINLPDEIVIPSVEIKNMQNF